ncbi:MAG: flagellin [Alphaproteobacteria bacterium]|nr:flagellin [Alphaproteobacteria bacterium]
MINSINTNTSAMIALQRFSGTRNGLDKTQSHISSGNKVNSPKDDAATLAVAERLLAAFSGTEAVRDGLDRASATIDVALAAGQSTADILVEMKGLAVQANQEGLDQSSRDALNSAFAALQEQIAAINNSAEFAGSNLIAAGAADQKVLSDENGARMTVAAQDLSTAGLGIDSLALDSAGNAAAALSAMDAAITDASVKMANLGSSAKSLETHNELLGVQNDTLRAGIGELVDADMAAESAALQSNQIKESLGIVSLAIANAAPSRMLALFGG